MSRRRNVPWKPFVALAAAVAAAGLWLVQSVAAAPFSEHTPVAAVAVTGDRVRVTLSGTAAPARAKLVEFPFHEEAADDAFRGTVCWTGDLTAAEQTVFLPRIDRDGGDRLFRKFRLFDATTNQPVGPQHFADDLQALPARGSPLPWPEGIKGISCPVDNDDMRDLGVRHVHINISPAAFFADDPTASTGEEFAVNVDGTTFYLRPSIVKKFDDDVEALTDLGINVFAVVTIPMTGRSPLIHPDAARGKPGANLSAFRMDDERAVNLLRAWWQFVGKRYTEPGMPHGAVGGWIVGNEVNSHYSWYNMGEVEPEKIVRSYADALRMAYLALRAGGSDVPIFTSFEHHWTMAHTVNRRRGMPGKVLLDRLAEVSRAEGNFPWEVAYHPYPENLFNPDFWNDRDATYAYDTKKITFKNIEVLADYLKKPELRVDGRPRRLILSEQGFNRPKTSGGDGLQAAAYAIAFYKLQRIPEVEAFILHRHEDHPGEGGLRLGVRTWGIDAEGNPSEGILGDKVPMWDVFQACGTPRQREASEFALKVAGFESWGDADPKKGPFPALTPGRPAAPEGTIDLAAMLTKATVKNDLSVVPRDIPDGTGAALPGWLQHPKVGPPCTVAFDLTLPAGKLNLHFGTLLGAPSADGVKYEVFVGDQRVFVEGTARQTLAWHDADLSRWAGQKVTLTFSVNAIKNSNYDSALWVQPAITSAGTK